VCSVGETATLVFAMAKDIHGSRLRFVLLARRSVRVCWIVSGVFGWRAGRFGGSQALEERRHDVLRRGRKASVG